MSSGLLYRVQQYTVECGLCNDQENRVCALQYQAEAYFRDLGWSHTKQHGWICLECAVKRGKR